MKFLKQKETRTEDLMLLNMFYSYGSPETGWQDSIDVVYKDLSTGKKHLEHIVEPKMEIFFTKDQYKNYDYNKYVLPIDHVEPKVVSYKNVLREIADYADGKYKQYYNICKQTGNKTSIKNLHKYNYVMASDYDLESYYRIQWALEYNNIKQKKITKLYSDIEVDGYGVEGFVDDGSCPINAISFLDQETMTSYEFLLRNEKNPQVEEFEKNIESFRKKCNEMWDDSYGKWDYKFMFYDEKDEIKMIMDFFNLVHTLKRDFLMYWNMNYDANYFMKRIKELGYDPAEIMCHPDFPVKKCYYYNDRKNFDPKTKKDWFTISDYTTWVDQMILYAQVRKGGGELGSVRLNNVGQKELKDEKIDYSDEANIKTLPYVNYEKFVTYSIKDSLLMYGIEQKTMDLETLYTRSILNQVPYKKVFSQTALLRNRCYVDFWRQGYVVGNNVNINYDRGFDDEPEEKVDEFGNVISAKEKGFSGALVADPILNSDKAGVKILGRRNKYVRRLVVDFDYSSLYPSIKITHNIGPNTLVGKIKLDMKVEDRYSVPDIIDGKYDPAKDLTEHMLCDNPIMTGVRWFNLPNMTEVLKQVGLHFKKDVSKIVPEVNNYKRTVC